MRDPSGDLPWEEDPTGSDVYHITDANVSVRPHKLIIYFKFLR